MRYINYFKYNKIFYKFPDTGRFFLLETAWLYLSSSTEEGWIGKTFTDLGRELESLQ